MEVLRGNPLLRWGTPVAAVLVSVFLLFSAIYSAAQLPPRPAENVVGVVLDRHERPVPGLTVRLNHPDLGPSFPVMTNYGGFYYFPDVPRNVMKPYTIEVFWGDSLIYRDIVRSLGEQPPIRLR